MERIKAEKDKTGKKEKPLPPIKDEEIPFDIPDNWVWCRLGEICDELLGGFAFDSTQYIPNSNNQVIRLGNVKMDKLVLDTSPTFISDDYSKEAEKSNLKEGDILITMTGTRAKRDYLYSLMLSKDDFQDKKLYLNQRVGCFRFSILVSREYLNKVLKDPRLLNPVFESATGAANQANIGVTALKEILIPLPPLSMQAQIVAKVEELMGLCDALEASIQYSKGVNEALLQQVLREALAG